MDLLFSENAQLHFTTRVNSSALSGYIRSVVDAGIWAPVRLAQGIIKKYAIIKMFARCKMKLRI